MPNWCHNRLQITGPLASLQFFQQRVADEEGGFSFSSLFPTPDQIDSSEGMDWRVEHWGTSNRLFEPCPAAQEADEVAPGEWRLLYEFSTAWSPPDAWVWRISELFPSLHFTLRYAEPGFGYAGEIEVGCGRILSKQTKDIEDILPREEDRWY